MREKNKIKLDALGDDNMSGPPTVVTAPSVQKSFFETISKVAGKGMQIDSEVIREMQESVEARLSNCQTHREILEMEANSLAECVGVATEIYKKNPVPDFAYQLSSLTNAHKSTLQQLEKMKDPKTILGDIESEIRRMFIDIVKAMAIEMDKTKRELTRLTPDQKLAIEDLFGRMLHAIQPQTQNVYEDLQKNLKRFLGIKG